jgi:glycosyltransferase involved in cell wall biosynthesis
MKYFQCLIFKKDWEKKIMDISVVIPCYNGEKYIARAIRSVLDQCYDNDLYEVIVVNDGSNDNTSKILDYYSDRVKIITNEKNFGLAYSRNEGIRNSKGRYILCVDADDYIHRDLLKIESSFLNLNPQWDAVSCDYFLIDDNEEHLCRIDANENPIACGILFRIERLIDIGLYDKKFKANEEKELRYRFEKKGYKIHHLPIPLYRYRRHENNMTNDSNLIKDWMETLNIKKRKLEVQ